MDDFLAPCPFCGNDNAQEITNEAGLYDSNMNSPYYCVVCSMSNDKPGCGASSGLRLTMAEAVKAWNRRSGSEGGA